MAVTMWALLTLVAGLTAAAVVSNKEPFANILIIGAGPAGLVLANRLSANTSLKIHVLEAGPDPTGVEEISTPGDAFNLYGTEYLWNFTTTPQAILGGQSPAVPQGHALGGGTTVNDMQYGRGAPSVFDTWADISGDDGWRWENFLPHFKGTTRLVMSNRSYAPTTDRSVYGKGPLIVSYNKEIDAFSPYFVNGFKESGVPEIDQNAGVGIGVTYTTNTIRQSNATRFSALSAFGYELANRPKVQVQHGAWVSKINFNGKKAVSVTYYRTSDGSRRTFYADEIIVSAGAINTPKLLMLSGVGPRKHLKDLGIPLVADIPEIGLNNYDHHAATVELNVSRTVVTASQWTTNATLYAQIQKQYRKHARGPLANPSNSGAAMIRVPDDVLIANNATYQLNLAKDRPHIMYQYVVLPVLPNNYTNANIISFSVILVAPEASGTVRLASANFRDNPLIDANYYGSQGDKACMLWAYKYIRELFKPGESNPLVINELFPGPEVQSDEDVWDAIAQTSGSYDHPVGTVSMGKALEKDFRLKGLKGIRVVDSSIIPDIPSTWLEATMYALADRAAGVILQGWRS